ncbi:MAG: PorP/SprF family type IX secretion system membrane protein [Bacteroidales bacterium]|nr:PorP/SprF family type IX secretion system membrane protein [Bacteroidales bacterium]MCF8454619.1 PorP/SprF family type IX secretion system membrane protein [Bacteroidales bacterium]
MKRIVSHIYCKIMEYWSIGVMEWLANSHPTLQLANIYPPSYSPPKGETIPVANFNQMINKQEFLLKSFSVNLCQFLRMEVFRRMSPDGGGIRGWTKYTSALLLLLLFFLPGIITTHAQDIHFSQFKSAPLALNPANTGNINGNFRMVNNFRSQWVSFADPGYNTLSLSYDQPLRTKGGNFSLGGLIIYDRSGTIGMTVSKIYVSGSYRKSVAKNKYFFGLQAGGVIRQFNDANALYSSQFDKGTGLLNPNLPSGEVLSESMNYFNLNAGFLWKRDFNRFRSEMGMSIFNLNYPKEGFSDSKERLQPKILYSAAFTFFVTRRFYIQPDIIYMHQSAAGNFVAGSEFLLMPNQQTGSIEGFFMGGYIRSGFNRTTDAAIITGGVKLLKLRVGLSFDLNISELQQYTNSVGAFEISIIYTGISTAFDPGALPCTRQ